MNEKKQKKNYITCTVSDGCRDYIVLAYASRGGGKDGGRER